NSSVQMVVDPLVGNIAHAQLPALRVYFCYRTSAILFGNRMVRYTSSGSTTMIRNRPVVTDDTLSYQEQGHEQIVPVGTPAWYAWLQSARAFTFRSSSGQFTARHERAGNGRGDWYW